MVIVAVWKKLMFYPITVVSDCHTKALRRTINGPLKGLFLRMKRWSLGTADLLIVSNDRLIDEASEYNQNIFVLPDLVPDLDASKYVQASNKYCAFVTTYAKDEPIETILQAALILSHEMQVFLTGEPPSDLLQKYKHSNGITLTGFLPEEKYMHLIANAACIVALTTEDNCLQCAGYEALALEIPLVTSDTAVLREYFGDAAVYTNNSVESIVKSIKTAIDQSGNLRKKIMRLKAQKLKQDILRLDRLNL